MYDLKLIGSRIKECRKEFGMTLDDVAQRVGVAKSTIQRYEAGIITTPKLPVLVAIANAFGVNEGWIKGISEHKEILKNNDNTENNRIPVPVLGEVSAGLGSYAADNITGYIFEDKDSLNENSDYAYLKVIGDSMYPEFKEGDLVLIKGQSTVESGSYAVVTVDDELGVIKRVIMGNKFIELQSVNPMYPPRRFEGKDMSRIRIIGLVKGMKRTF